MKVEDASEHHAVVLVQGALRARLHHEQSQFVGAVHVLVTTASRMHADQTQQRVGDGVEQRDERTHDAREQHKRPREHHADALRCHQRDRLRRQFTEHDVQKGDDQECRRDARRGVRQARTRVDAKHREATVHNRCQRGFADPAQRERREGDPKLGP